LTNWPTYLSHEYSGAAVRLAALLEKGSLHLVFACVELYPTEVPLPPAVALEQANLGDARIYFGLYKMSCADALVWYENVANGNPIVPDTKRPISSPPLGAEPMLGRLVSYSDIPFSAAWHGGPRIHRLVPLRDLDISVSQFVATEKPHARQKPAREWLAQRLHFDVLAHDDWVGGAALLVPNPVVRSLRMSVFPGAAGGGETVRVVAQFREKKLTNTLFVNFREIRFDALAAVETVRVDQYGRAELLLPETTCEIAAELHCDQRGLLAVVPPSGFVRSIHTNVDVASAPMDVLVPSARSGGQPTAYRRHPRSTSSLTTGADSLPTTTRRLNELNRRYAVRSGEARSNSMWREPQIDEAIFFDDRGAATSFIRSLIGRARSEVVLVDPFFDHIALREFGIATSYDKMSVRVLLGRDLLRKTVPLHDETTGMTGDVIFSELADFRANASNYRISVPKLRLMGGNCRKYHDRFVILDGDVWHCGHSFNQVGRAEVSMMTRLRNPQRIRSEILADLEDADDFEDMWLLEARTRQSQRQSRWKTICARLGNLAFGRSLRSRNEP